MKPTRQFTADEGDYSTGIGGPDAIEDDLDCINAMFDPLAEHTDGEPGGIGAENMQENAISDGILGERTIDPAIADPYSNSGTVTSLLSWLAKIIKTITGETHWFSDPKDSISNIDTRITDNLNNINELDVDISDNYDRLTDHKTSMDHDARYYTKSELAPWLQGGDTLVHEDIFTIISPDNGDGTFTYYVDEQTIEAPLGEAGEQVFELQSGVYELSKNKLEVIINDTLRRSAKSGGINEISPTSFALTAPEGAGAEITAKYYERISTMGEYNVRVSSLKPPFTGGKTLWLEILE